jgi:hypothetical protein
VPDHGVNRHAAFFFLSGPRPWFCTYESPRLSSELRSADSVAIVTGTLIVILPTNKQLLNPALDRRSAETGLLLARWGKLHAVRSVLWRSCYCCIFSFSRSLNRAMLTNAPPARRSVQVFYGHVIMKATSQRSDPFFRGALWIIAISWITIVVLVFAFYFSVLLLNFLFQR